MIIVSACLVGINCRYDGNGFCDKTLAEMVEAGKAIAVCPETLGGLGIPRKPCEIKKNEGNICITDKEGNDFTKEYEAGAEKVLEVCKKNNIEVAVLKSKSPSCGCGEIYDGRFNGTLIKGNGLTAEKLLKNGIEVYSDLDYRGEIYGT